MPRAYRNGHPAAPAHQEEVYGGQGWLTAVNVQKSYRGRKVVKGVSIATGRGEAVGLLGPNGAGKTTVFYMITGLVPADAGRITLDGRDVTRLPMYRRARLGIGYLPQEASIFRGMTVEQNIMAVLELVEPRAQEAQGAARQPARGVQHHPAAQVAVAGTVGRRAPALRDRARAGLPALVHAAGRAVRRHRPDGRRRHSGAGAPFDRSAESGS